MREILFRGKRLDNGEWVEGWYQPETTIKHWNGIQETVGVTIADKVEDGYLEDTLVDPPTVGQYTGLTDKNGKRIFEGDIVKAYNEYISEVTFRFGSFCCYCQCHDTHNMLWCVSDILTVIGSIHDNPELLKGDNK